MLPLLLAALFQLQIPAPVGYVNDFAGVIRPEESAAISGIIDEVRRKSGGEIVVITLRDIGDRASIDVARDIGRQWKVGAQGGAGDPRRNTGVVLLLVPGQRPGDHRSKVAIATGSGTEGFVTDFLAGRVRDAIGREAVRSGSFGAGLEAGVRLLAVAYAGEFHFHVTVAPVAPSPAAPEEYVPNGGFPWFYVLVAVLLALMAQRRRGMGGLASVLLLSSIGSRRGGGWGGGGGSGGGGGGGGFGGFGGGGGFSGGGASGGF